MYEPDHHNHAAGPARRQALLDQIERGGELPLMTLSFALIPLVTALLFWELQPSSRAVAFACTLAIWAVFAVELLIRLAIAPRRGYYLRQHWLDGLIVLLPVAQPLRVIWIISRGSRAHRYPLRLAHVDFLGVYAVGLVLVIATIVTSLERGHDSSIDSFPDALWWSIATVTTVGYGDVVPVTAPGRACAYVLMLGGIGLFGALTANFASMLARREDPAKAGLAALRDEVRDLRAALERTRERDGLG
ncbi:potassium channel family protein [Candidatus Spongiisocius sp.]|uniref:potassium channel family protein n=1 Tax=Candidatus Spongiisocius sp. TaxID=3101273 RepID=UPI003B5BB291